MSERALWHALLCVVESANPGSLDALFGWRPAPLLAGHFGRVYLGQYQGQVVAVKVIQMASSSDEGSAERRISRECEISAACRHPNIVPHIAHFTVAAQQQSRSLLPCLSPSRCGVGWYGASVNVDGDDEDGPDGAWIWRVNW